MSPAVYLVASLLHNIGVHGGSSIVYAVLLMATKPLTAKEIEKQTNYSKSTVSMHLQTLQNMGLVSRVRKGGIYRYYPQKKIHELYMEHVKRLIEWDINAVKASLRRVLAAERKQRPESGEKEIVHRLLADISKVEDMLKAMLKRQRSTSV